jgi:hypothetical protein
MARRTRSHIRLSSRSHLLNDRDPMQRIVTRRFPKYVVNQPGPGIGKRTTKRYMK